MEAIGNWRGTALAVLACAISIGCTASVAEPPGGGEVAVVDLDSKADTIVRLDLGAVELLRFRCDLERCRHQLSVLESRAARTLVLATGSAEDVLELRDAVVEGRTDEVPEGIELRTSTAQDVEDGLLAFYLNVPRGDVYGILFAVEPVRTSQLTVQVRLRLLLDFDEAVTIHEWAPRSYYVESTVDDGTQAWQVPIVDVLEFLGHEWGSLDSDNPFVEVSFDGNVEDLDLTTYYQCNAGGVVVEGGPTVVGNESLQYDRFKPDCPTADDGGQLYVEVTGRGAYLLQIHRHD